MDWIMMNTVRLRIRVIAKALYGRYIPARIRLQNKTALQEELGLDKGSEGDDDRHGVPTDRSEGI